MDTVYIMNNETKEIEVLRSNKKHKLISLGIHTDFVVLLYEDELDEPQTRVIDTDRFYVSVG